MRSGPAPGCALQAFEALGLSSSKPQESTRLSPGSCMGSRGLREDSNPNTSHHLWRTTGTSGMSELGSKPPVDAAVSTWIQPHLLYCYPIQGGLMPLDPQLNSGGHQCLVLIADPW